MVVLWYIISPKKIEYFISLNIPEKDEYGNKDLDLFALTEIGQEFFNLEPLRLGHKTSKKEIISSISTDIAWISMCYNVPLYVYVISDRYYNKNLNLGFSSCTHLSCNKRLQDVLSGVSDYSSEESKKLKIPKENRYAINLYEDVEERITNMLNNMDLKNNAYFCVKWTIKGILRE